MRAGKREPLAAPPRSAEFRSSCLPSFLPPPVAATGTLDWGCQGTFQTFAVCLPRITTDLPLAEPSAAPPLSIKVTTAMTGKPLIPAAILTAVLCIAPNAEAAAEESSSAKSRKPSRKSQRTRNTAPRNGAGKDAPSKTGEEKGEACSWCNGSGKCYKCHGTKQCSSCDGTGKA